MEGTVLTNPKPSYGIGVSLVSLIVRDYDSAIDFFTKKLGFVLVEDCPSLTNDGRHKRWVVVSPPLIQGSTSHGAAILLARADGPQQEEMIGRQFAGRVGLFWRVENFDVTFERLKDSGVAFLTEPKLEQYGCYAVFLDISGNKWDLLGQPVVK